MSYLLDCMYVSLVACCVQIPKPLRALLCPFLCCLLLVPCSYKLSTPIPSLFCFSFFLKPEEESDDATEEGTAWYTNQQRKRGYEGRRQRRHLTHFGRLCSSLFPPNNLNFFTANFKLPTDCRIADSFGFLLRVLCDNNIITEFQQGQIKLCDSLQQSSRRLS